jgi:hypothetical protein
MQQLSILPEWVWQIYQPPKGRRLSVKVIIAAVLGCKELTGEFPNAILVHPYKGGIATQAARYLKHRLEAFATLHNHQLAG